MDGFRVRKYRLTVPTDGSTTPSIFIGNEPNACGWLLSFAVALQDGQFITANLDGRDEWESNRRGVRFHEWDCNRGGNLFVPYPSLNLTFTDSIAGSGADETVIMIVARSVSLGTQVDHYNSVLFGTSGPATVASGATQSFTAPAGAGWFQANIGAAGGDWIVTSNRVIGGGAAQTLAQYALDFAEKNSGDVGGEAWRVLGPNATVTMRNNHGSASGSVTCFWRYDLKNLG
jgi:hypothetical protein